MADELVTPELEKPAAQVDPGERLTGQLAARARRAPPIAEAALPKPQDETAYKTIPFGSKYISPEGETLTKHYRPKSAVEYAKVPEGAEYMSPEGEVLTKKKTEPLSFTAQTLFNMGVNDKERRKALERSYPGMVRNNPHTGELEVVEKNGTIRRPKGFTEAPVATAASGAAPVTLSVLGAIGGGTLGTVEPGGGNVVGGYLGAAGGAMLGQTFNDIILGLTGVRDRSDTEQGVATLSAGASALIGAGVGRGIASVAPGIKAAATHGVPTALASFLGAEKKGLEMGLQLREKDVLVPPSTWAKESPMAINISEVYDPAFRTQRPLEQSATKHMEDTSKQILRDAGVAPPESITKPTAAVSTREAGQAVLNRAQKQLQEADMRLAAELERRKSVARGQGQQVAVDPESLQKTAVEARKAADTLIKQGFDDIQRDVDQAMAAAKAGHNSGDLWWAVGEKLRLLRQGISERASIMYDHADQLAGGHLPDIEGLPDTARNFFAQLPEGFENRWPSIVKQLRDIGGVIDHDGNVVKEAVNPTFGQLHNLRSFMRSNFNYFNLTSDVKEGTFKYFSQKVDAILQNPGAVPELKDAARALREADTFYRENMGPLTDRRIQSVMDGLSSGMPADPKVLFDVLVKEGRSEVTKKARELVGPTLWAGVKASDVQEMLDLSKLLVPDMIDGRAFAKQVLDRHRHGMLEAVHGKEASDKLIRQAQAVEALEGRLDMPVRPGDTLGDVISRARLASEAVQAAGKTDPLAALNKEMHKIELEMKRERGQLHRALEQDPLGFLYKPTTLASTAADKILDNGDLVLAAAMRFDKNSPEFKMLQQAALHKVLHGTMDPGARIAHLTEEVQQILFPGATGKQLETLAKEMDFLMSSKAASIGTGQSIAAQSRVTHPWGQIPVFRTATKITGMDFVGRKILGSYYQFVLETLNRPGLMRFILKGLEGDTASRLRIREEMRKIMRRGQAIGAGVGEAEYQAPRQPQRPRPVRPSAIQPSMSP